MYEVTIHFADGREPAGFLAEEFDTLPEARDEDSGLQRFAYVAPGGRQAAVCLNPGSVAAIVPAFAEPDRQSGHSTPEKAPAGALPLETRQPERGREPEPDKSLPASRDRRKPGMADLQWGRFPRSEELERKILTFLARFGAATPAQLMRWHPLHKHFVEGGGRYSLATERFFFSEERACDYLDGMRSEGLVTSSAARFQSDADTVFGATDEGMKVAGLGSLSELPSEAMRGSDYHLKMVDLYQGIMGSLHEDAAWVTGRELQSAEYKTAREEELGRKLPSVLPGRHQFWPAAPEGMLVLRESGVAAAVGLETTRVSNRRIAVYETIFEVFSRDRAVDRAYYFFTHEEARPRVEKLAERYRRDGFFVLRDYRTEDPLGISEG